jgi:hypothetical protein
LHPDEPDWLCRSAILRLYHGDIDGYRRRCQEALRFGGTEQPDLAHKIALAILLIPDPAGDSDQLLEMANVAARTGRSIHRRTLAIAHYRQGRVIEAHRLLHQVATVRSGGYSDALTLFFLAMTHYQMGETAEANRRMEEAVANFERSAASVTTGNFGSLWRDWVTVAVVRREAESLMHPVAP